ncbi:hypothetical protein scyTo_0005702 [Scyliorhinus torazame]|uniref:Metallo-beta-lactamase domain-containing protein n=1 Tax=Scyliorhinus torazame TaxID=75743 RepID=A0A401PBM9_SCYTO|nr:hypothetical protein [Scyliorhinus torazame]
MLFSPIVNNQEDADWDWFWWEEVSYGLYLIRERFFEPNKRANIWLVQGSLRDLVIDAGLGLRDLRSYLEATGLIGSKAVMAVATHIHFEHSGGLHHFDRVAVHRAEAKALMRGNNFETATWLYDSEITRTPQKGWRAKHYRVKAVQPSRILDHAFQNLFIQAGINRTQSEKSQNLESIYQSCDYYNSHSSLLMSYQFRLFVRYE